jgi:aminoglycoside phosphotransferase (APT) family kinase protein
VGQRLEALRDALSAALPVAGHRPLQPPLDVRRLSGGYSWQTNLVRDAAGRELVIRVAPAGGTLDPYDPRVEQRALEAARGCVPAPQVLAVAGPDNPLGAAFSVQTVAPGRVLALREVTDPEERAAYRRSFAETLGHLHARGDLSPMWPVPETVREALDTELERTAAHLVRSVPCAHPGLGIALRWLATHRPDSDRPPVLCHGDFRFHNLSWTGPGKLGAVLDWERAWPGDPMSDIAFTRRFSGWCAVDDEETHAIYESASKRYIDEDRVAYGLRFEQLRSYSSSFRGVRALADGRSESLALYGVGEAGDAAAWELCEWLADGPLRPLSPAWQAPTTWRPLVSGDRRAVLADRAARVGEDRLAAHLDSLPDEDAAALDRSHEALQACAADVFAADEATGTALARALVTPSRSEAWAAAYAVLTEAARTGGAELLPALRALSLRTTLRPTLRSTRMAGA